jgi:hypothetical protein
MYSNSRWEKENILGKSMNAGQVIASGEEAAGVYVDIDQSNGVDRSLVTCETAVSDDDL